MKPEQQRIKIAEVCPQTIRLHRTFWQYRVGRNWVDCADNDPLHDLNALHEAQKIALRAEVGSLDPIKWALWEKYVGILGDRLTGDEDVAFATASQGWEAFLRTLGLWEGA